MGRCDGHAAPHVGHRDRDAAPDVGRRGRASDTPRPTWAIAAEPRTRHAPRGSSRPSLGHAAPHVGHCEPNAGHASRGPSRAERRTRRAPRGPSRAERRTRRAPRGPSRTYVASSSGAGGPPGSLHSTTDRPQIARRRRAHGVGAIAFQWVIERRGVVDVTRPRTVERTTSGALAGPRSNVVRTRCTRKVLLTLMHA